MKLESPIYKPKKFLYSLYCSCFGLKEVLRLLPLTKMTDGQLQTVYSHNPQFTNGSKLTLYINELERTHSQQIGSCKSLYSLDCTKAKLSSNMTEKLKTNAPLPTISETMGHRGQALHGALLLCFLLLEERFCLSSSVLWRSL